MLANFASFLLHRSRAAWAYGGLIATRALSTTVVRPGDATIVVPRALVDTNFSRSSGAGGQNVNKVNTKAEVRFKLDDAAWMDEGVKARFRDLWSSAINGEGEVYLSSQRHRTQEANLEDVFDKLTLMVRKAAVIPKVRMQRTGLSELTKQERREDKRHRSAVKTRRRTGVSWDD